MWKALSFLSQGIHMCNMKAISLLIRKLWQRLKFFKRRSRSKGQKLWYHVKGLVTRNKHVQYESPISSGKKVIAKVKIFQKWVKLQGQGHEVKNYGTIWKVLSQGIHMCNMKALSLLVRKLWQRFKFFKCRSNFKVMRSKRIFNDKAFFFLAA